MVYFKSEIDSNDVLTGKFPTDFFATCRKSTYLFVRMRGLEPPRVAPHDPKSCASASSATSALFFNELKGRPKPGVTFDQFFHHFWVILSVQKHTT